MTVPDFNSTASAASPASQASSVSPNESAILIAKSPTSLTSALSPFASPQAVTAPDRAKALDSRTLWANMVNLVNNRSITPKSDWRDGTISNTQRLSELLELLRNSQVACPKWDRFTVKELRVLIRERGISARNAKLKADYIKVLVEDDETTPFRFTDLPPEIRVLIHNHVLAENTNLTALAPFLVSQPAILYTSRATRNEALPVFYGSNRVALSFELGRLSQLESSIEMTKTTKAWLTAIGSANVRSIRRLSVELLINTRLIVLNLDLGAVKTEKHLTFDRTCQYHEAGARNCRRWKRLLGLEEVAKLPMSSGISYDAIDRVMKEHWTGLKEESKDAGAMEILGLEIAVILAMQRRAIY